MSVGSDLNFEHSQIAGADVHPSNPLDPAPRYRGHSAPHLN